MKSQLKIKKPKFQYRELLIATLNESSRYQISLALLEGKNYEQ